MANQLKTKFIGNDQVNSEKILLENNTPLRGKDSSGNEQDLLKIDGSDKIIVYRDTGPEELAYISDVNAGGTALQDHIDDPTGAHAASAISVSAIANMAATDVQAALAELQGDIDSIDATYVNVSGDTMTGALTIDQNSVQLSLQSESISNNGSLSISGSTELVLDAGGGIGNISLSADNVFIGTADIRNSQFDNIRIALNDVASSSAIYMGADGGVTTLQQETLVVKTTSGATAFEVSNAGSIDKVSIIQSGQTINNESRISFLGSTLELSGGSQPGSKISAITQLDMEGNKIVDIQQLENLSAASISGNALRYDELGVYSVGAGYGIASLGPDGKIPANQLPAAVMEYKGTWDASTNTPTLANGNPPNAPEDAGHLYIVSVGGTVNFGAGNISFNAGDSVILNASLVWEKSTTANLVTSVNGAQGVVVLDSEDLTYHQGNASDWTVADDSSIKLTLDEVGSRLTASESDITDLQNEDLTFLKLDGSRPMQGSLQMEAYPIQLVNNVNDYLNISYYGLGSLYSDPLNDVDYSYTLHQSSGFEYRKDTIATEDEVYRMAYSNGKLSLTEALGVPMVASAPEHVIVKATLDSEITSVSNSISAVADDVSHLVTLSGMPVDSDNLGSFTGSTIPDSQTIKQALQSLETAHEAHLNDTVDAHDASAISLSPAINGQTDVQSAMGDHESRIDAIEAIQYATPYKKTLVAGDITNGYINLPHLAVQTNGMRVCVDRLALHQGASEDYTLSVVGGVTRITFLNDLVTPGQQQLSTGDNIYVVYQISV